MGSIDLDGVLRQVLRDELRPVREELAQLRAELAAQSQHGDPDELIGVVEVARLLGRTVPAVRRAHERGTLKVRAVKTGKRQIRFRRGDVLALAGGR